jgi:hypothetical protein
MGQHMVCMGQISSPSGQIGQLFGRQLLGVVAMVFQLMNHSYSGSFFGLNCQFNH